MMALSWTRAADGGWCELDKVDLAANAGTGVYVIWHGGTKPRTIRVGYGPLAGRLSAHRSETGLLRYRQFGPLYVSWAAVPETSMQGVAKFVGSRLRPTFEDRLALAVAIPASLPG